MSTLGTTRATLIDVARSLDPNGSIADVAEILQEDNEILDDVIWKEGNLPTGHQMTVRTSLVTPTFRLLNGGVVPAKATNGQITDACAIMEARSHVDVNVANINGNAAAFRGDQDRAFISSFGQTLADTLINGDSSVYPEQFNGLATRYFTLGSTYATYGQVIDAGGTGSDNTSIWLVGWSPSTVYGIYPKGSKAGLVREDRGIQDLMVDTTTSAYMRAYVTWFQWMCGLAVQDYRYVVRICNIDVSALKTASDGTDTSANILKYMIQALGLIPSQGNPNLAFYMNRTVQSMLAVKLLDKSNVWLSMDEVKNSPVFRPRGVLKFQGVPCRRIDKITETESQITTATT